MICIMFKLRFISLVLISACVLLASNPVYAFGLVPKDVVLTSLGGVKESQFPQNSGSMVHSPRILHYLRLADFQVSVSELDNIKRILSIPNTLAYDTLKSTIALFVVIDPIGTVPLFIALTEKLADDERKAVSKTAVITSGILLMVFAIAGTQILAIFGITIFSFMIAGGILLFIVSVELLTHGIWRFGSGGSGESGVVPLAFPLLAGPGAITSVIISFQAGGLLVTLLSVTVVIGATYMILRSVNHIYKLIGRRGAMIVTRVFAVFIAAIAVQYIIEGVRHFFT